MLIKRLRAFHEKTLERYNEEYRRKMEAWKEDVSKLHEDAGFLFYYENCELAEEDGSQLIIQGDVAKADDRHSHRTGEEPVRLYMYDGQGRRIGAGLMLSDPFEKEEKRRGFLSFRKHEFLFKLTSLYGENFSEINEGERKRLLLSLYRELSLIADI